MSEAFFDVPLNLPHAATVAGRIVRLLEGEPQSQALAVALMEPLLVYKLTFDDQRSPMAYASRDRAAERGRQLVDEIEQRGLGHDRLGQCVRNLFECFEFGLEGARLGLLAGENPESLQRPK